MKITNRTTVVITGASAGVGRAVAHEFAKLGCQIGLIARNREALNVVRREVELLGGTAIVLPLDVSNAELVEAAASKVESAFGHIDVWVNNAMVSVFSPIREMTPIDFQRVTEVTYLGYVYGSLAALKRMLIRNSGVIVQVSSALAYRSIPLQSAYCAAKHAVKGFTESLVTELLHDKSHVKVTMVHLPAVNTPQFDWSKSRMENRAQPVPPIFQPELAAEAILWATEHTPKDFTPTFSAEKAIIAEKLIPEVADRFLAGQGYSAQQTSEPEDSQRANNLFEPVDASSYHTHGRFDAYASPTSPYLKLEESKRWLIPLMVAGGAISALLYGSSRARKAS
jgi:NAD(P)-dependent dehydrogenase (short-subunit alcohol dehydrogenase family)